MMGKSVELLGMACFNVFLGMILTVSFVSQATKNGPSLLTEASVSDFVSEMTNVSWGKKADMDQYGITTWFMDHIVDSGTFTNTINISQPNGEDSQQVLEMDRMKYISQVLQEMKAVQNHHGQLNIEYVKIDDGGQSASVVFTSLERGDMPVASEGTEYTIPVTGMSYCEQKIILQGKLMKVVNGTCTTNVTLTESF